MAIHMERILVGLLDWTKILKLYKALSKMKCWSQEEVLKIYKPKIQPISLGKLLIYQVI